MGGGGILARVSAGIRHGLRTQRSAADKLYNDDRGRQHNATLHGNPPLALPSRGCTRNGAELGQSVISMEEQSHTSGGASLVVEAGISGCQGRRMMSDELATLSARELVALFRRGEASPVEATGAALARLEACNAAVNAFSLIDPDRAMRDAEASQVRWQAGSPASDIDGVPATIKDIILTRGWPTLRGSRTIDPAQEWPEDAPAVARLREAGAILLGKTTTPEFGWKAVCDSPLTGITRNPWQGDKTSGGSSGGAAAAAALRMGCLHLGTDGGGSIRIPAGFSGVFGFKPTFGLVPAYPLSPFGTIAHLGPITANVEDAARMLTILVRPDDRDWHSLPYRPCDFSGSLDRGVSGVRMALSVNLGYAHVDPEIVSLVEAAAVRLAAAGAMVERRDPGFASPAEIFRAHWFTGAASVLASVPPQRRALLDPGFVRIAREGERLGHMDYVTRVNERAALGLQMALFHRDFDILLTPTLPLAAFEAGKLAPPGSGQSEWADWTPFTYPFNLTQQPAASIPCGFTAKGLPVGLQIVAAKYQDALVLRVARAYEELCPIRLPR
jgi:aspartyl-tRNA(Asn)/glutamyl-tRNA(Gln) amidotransferase subunit A